MLDNPGDLTRLDGVRVLLVDDHQDTLELYRCVLEKCGASVMTVTESAQALDHLAAHRPDVLVADILLGDDDGCDLMRSIRELDENEGGRTPAIAISGWATAGDRSRGIDAGYQVYLGKPVELEVLTAVIASLATGAICAA